MGHACSTKRSRRTGRRVPPVAAYVAFDVPDMQLLEQYERTTGRAFPRDRFGGCGSRRRNGRWSKAKRQWGAEGAQQQGPTCGGAR
jgi:hypothetical protein